MDRVDAWISHSLFLLGGSCRLSAGRRGFFKLNSVVLHDWLLDTNMKTEVDGEFHVIS